MNLVLLYIFKIINRLFKKFYSKVSFYNAWNYAYKISLQGIGHQQGVNVKINGEINSLIRVLDNPSRNYTIFDVGANKGEYSKLIFDFAQKKNFELIKIHAFEPSPSNIDSIEKVRKSINSEHSKFIINNFGLSDFIGNATLFADEKGSDLGSIVDLRISVRPFNKSESEKIKITTLDQYVEENNIDIIDLLKLDVEGAEFNILKGSSKCIQNGIIKNIQFEFGTANISSRIFFIDFWELLSSNYTFYKVLRDGLIRIDNYHPRMENFITTNYFLSKK